MNFVWTLSDEIPLVLMLWQDTINLVSYLKRTFSRGSAGPPTRLAFLYDKLMIFLLQRNSFKIPKLGSAIMTLEWLPPPLSMVLSVLLFLVRAICAAFPCCLSVTRAFLSQLFHEARGNDSGVKQKALNGIRQIAWWSNQHCCVCLRGKVK